MARNNSFIKLEGTLDGLTFYTKNGENLVKKKNQVSRNRMLNAPEYEQEKTIKSLVVPLWLVKR